MASSEIGGGKRLFLALPLSIFSEEIAQYLELCQRQIKEFKWVKPEQVHLTLHFFGSVEAFDIPKIEACVKPLTHGLSPFQLYLEGIGFFPDTRRPRVLWLGMAGDSERLIQFQSRLTEKLEEQNFEVEKRLFSPHATVARCKEIPPRLVEAIKRLSFEKTETKAIDRIMLYESQLSPQGSHYEKIREFKLNL